MLAKLISGGQTGVDRAALDVALDLGIPCGGWCPLGRRAEDGPIAPHYPLTETGSPAYPVRTRWNVRDADATLILTRGAPDRGTALTCTLAEKMRKPLLVVRLDESPAAASVQEWMAAHAIGILNVAGPRESSQPGIYAQSREFLLQVLAIALERARQGSRLN
jgi:hypothetical protein